MIEIFYAMSLFFLKEGRGEGNIIMSEYETEDDKFELRIELNHSTFVNTWNENVIWGRKVI